MAPILRRLRFFYRNGPRAAGAHGTPASAHIEIIGADIEAGLTALRTADAFRDSGRPDLAADGYRVALAKLPDRNDIRVQLGNMLKDSRQYNEAEAVYREAASVDPLNSDIYLQLGRALKLADRRDEAILALRRAIEVTPSLEAAVDELGRLLPVEDPSVDDAGRRIRSSVTSQVPGYLAGWVIDTERVREPVRLDIGIDGVHYQSVMATLERGDLKRIAPDVVGGGFEVRLPPGRGEVAVAVSHDGHLLRGFPRQFALQPGQPKGYLRPPDAARRPKVAIVVPVYNAVDETAACLRSIVRFTTVPAELIVVDDASPDPRVRGLLAKLAGANGIRIICNAENLGYTRTVNKALGLADGADVVLLNSDTVVGPRWLEGLRTAAYSRSDIASVTAISDNAGAFSVPEMNARLPWPGRLSDADYQRLVAQTSGTYWPELPTGNGFCLYLRRDAIDALGEFDATAFPRGYGEENDWCLRGLRAGWRHIVDDRTLVLHERSASFGAAKADLMASGRQVIDARYPEYGAAIAAFHSHPGLCGARHRVRRVHMDLVRQDEAEAGGPLLAVRVRPRVLFVISTETGGTPLTNRDLMLALSDRYEPWLLSCDSRSMAMSKVSTGDFGADQIVESHVLTEPVTLVEHRSADYDSTIARWLVEHAIELVHVRHLAWHSLELPAVARSLGVPVILSFHDFYTVCPTVKLLDERLVYCGGRCTGTTGDCVPDLWRVSVRPPLKHRWINEWRRRHGEVIDACDAFVTTSDSAKATLIDAYPLLAERRFEVIAHGRDFAEWFPPAPGPSQALEQLDILVPGNISPAKGRDLIEQLAALDRDRRLRFHILGEVHPELTGDGVVHHGIYKREEFPEKARRTRSHIGAVLSIWSETYCHTLTEMWAIGLPVVGFDFGAVAERIKASGAGWILPHDDVAGLYQALCEIADRPEEIAEKSVAVERWQRDEGRINGCRQMAGRYSAIYEDVFARRLNFGHVTFDDT
jgi:GT2 family glycosyltransferase/glycosyltransferase involved in cell wall biosynthesis